MKLNDQLEGILHDLTSLSTETCLMLGAIVLLIVGLITSKKTPIKIGFLIILAVALFLNLQLGHVGLLLSDSLFVDGDIQSFASLFLAVGALALLFPRTRHGTEFYFLLIALIAGSLFIMKANSLLLIYLAIELVSLASYVLTGFSFKKEGFEASIKYLLFGALSAAMMLVGLALIYGATGDLYVSDWTGSLFTTLLPQVGLLLFVFGIFFKISIFPFHVWTPATYQAAPVDAVAVLSVIPKLAGLLLLNRLLHNAGLAFDHWLVSLFLVLGICSILVGTLGALRQSNARRMISFGSIAHSGFLFAFVVTPASSYNPEALWFYAVVYAVMNMAVFYLLDRYENKSIVSIEDYAASKREAWIGGVFTLLLVSLVGLPPLAGFTAKLFLFSTLWEIYQAQGSILTFVYLLIAVFASIASLFFYLRIPKQIFLSEKPANSSGTMSSFSQSSKIIATIFAITLLMLFFAPKLVMSLRLLLNNVHE